MIPKGILEVKGMHNLLNSSGIPVIVIIKVIKQLGRSKRPLNDI